MKVTTNQKELKKKFVRRKDLDAKTRLEIIKSSFKNAGIYGAMTKLAVQYNVSRTFLYQLIGLGLMYLAETLDAGPREIKSSQLDVEPLIVLLRLEGKCSISSISEILKTLNYLYNSDGMISQLLKKYGTILPSTLSSSQEYQVIYLSDEIFALGLPILITIEPKSTAILKIELASDRSSKTWQNHFAEVHEFVAKGLASDRGTGITAGFEAAYPQLPWYSDHFHELRGIFKLLIKFEKQAYAAIDYEHDRLCKLENARSKSNIKKRQEQYEQATKACLESIESYEQIESALSILLPSLYFINHLKTPEKSEAKENPNVYLNKLKYFSFVQIVHH